MKVAIAHVNMQRGGSEARAMWGIAALKNRADVTLLTTGHVNLDELNACYGTSLAPHDFQVRRAPLPPGMRGSTRGAAVRGSLFQRFLRRVAGDYDVLVSVYNLCDFGVPAVQFIADFSWDAELMQRMHPLPPAGLNRIVRAGWGRRAYLGFARMWRRPSRRDLFAGEDLLIANSRWTAQLMQQRHRQAELQVVYPPVAEVGEPPPWQQRASGFVCLGRVAHEKRIETGIEILQAVRERGHDIHLHVIGPIGNDPYGRMIRRLLQEQAEWVFAEGMQVGPDKARLLNEHRYAIHACPTEAFGIAVAEQVKAGCIPFVHAEGGAAEIVDDPQLTYRTVDEAVLKIDRVLRDEAEQHRLRDHLAARGRLFGIRQFMHQFRSIVESFAGRKLGADTPGSD